MFAVVDIETTGGSPRTEKITEIAIYLHDGLSVVDEYSTLINPECTIPYFITGLTGISNEMVVDAPKFYEVAKKIVEPVAVNDNGNELAVVVKDSDTSSERELLIRARSAFHQGDILGSENYYIQLTELDHDNADIFGELGNVYYSQGKWDKAGQTYYEAAVRLITEGNYNQVAYLQRVIKGLNTEHADKLAQLMLRR